MNAGKVCVEFEPMDKQTQSMNSVQLQSFEMQSEMNPTWNDNKSRLVTPKRHVENIRR